jgi:hypothetical protein
MCILLQRNKVTQGVQLFSFLGTRIVFLLDAMAKKSLLTLFVKTGSQSSLSLAVLFQK